MPRAANPTLREDILKAALHIVEEHGTSGVTMRAVAGVLGYSATAIYQHFDSKEQLLLTIKLQASDLLAQEMELAREEPTLEEQLFQMGRRYIRFGLENPTFYQLMFEDMSLETVCIPEQLERTRQSWAIMRATLNTWARERGFQEIDVDSEANVLWMMVHGLTSLSLAERLPSTKPSQKLDNAFALFELSGSRWMAGLLSMQSHTVEPQSRSTRNASRTTSKPRRPRTSRTRRRKAQ